MVGYEEFELRARADWDRIPDSYKEGIDGLTVERAAKAHPTLPEVFTLGECVTESWPSEFGGPETIRSIVVLYYGSFFRLSRIDADFDWKAELWETLTHELQHHLESLADDEGLLDLDYAMDENFKRVEGQSFDPVFYRSGRELGGGWFQLEDEYFCEVAVEGAGDIVFDWEGTAYRVLPEPPADGGGQAADAPSWDGAGPPIQYLRVMEGLEAPPRELYVVLRRRTGWRDTLRQLFGRAPASDGETTAEREVTVEGVTDE
jgi:hypothetical protein